MYIRISKQLKRLSDQLVSASNQWGGVTFIGISKDIDVAIGDFVSAIYTVDGQIFPLRLLTTFARFIGSLLVTHMGESYVMECWNLERSAHFKTLIKTLFKTA